MFLFCLTCLSGLCSLLKLDETLMERLWGLTEMFPDTVRSAAEVSAQCSVSIAKKFYRYFSVLFLSHLISAQMYTSVAQ